MLQLLAAIRTSTLISTSYMETFDHVFFGYVFPGHGLWVNILENYSCSEMFPGLPYIYIYNLCIPGAMDEVSFITTYILAQVCLVQQLL